MSKQFIAFLATLIAAAPAVAEKPNIIVILTDDQGWGDLSLNGNTNLSTPNIDSLARDGASFDRFYVCPVCSPTRAEFLTGRYHPRSGVYSTSAGGERMDLDEATIADTFKAAGYATAAFGKWHNGMQYPYHPNGRGFDEYYGFCSGHWGDYFSPPLEHNGQIVRGNGFMIDDFTDRAIQFIEQNKDGPFFAYLPYNTPHSPMQVPDRWWAEFKDKKLAMRNREPDREKPLHLRAALAMCENIDWNVGRILGKLDEFQIADNTIVIYFCDNGPNGVRWNGDMKGRKGSTDEGGVRSPMLIRWPATIPAAREILQIGAAIDLLPTLADLADVQVASEKPLDGISLKSALLARDAPVEDRMIFSHWRNRVSVRTQRFRLDHEGKLYDIPADPGQRKDVASSFPADAQRLRKAVADWTREVVTGYDQDDRPFVVGHPGSRFTQIPARDGIAHGNIKRSNQFPNCSFFSNWLDVNDSITWDVEVGSSGSYEVEIHYSCPEADIGSTIQLSFNRSTVQTRVSQAHDPPLRGHENDRFNRQESYVKDFQAMKMGTIRLEKGRGKMTLKALEIPGSQVMDFRLMMLTRVE
jgi:arylsulfatase A-like enzyme